MKRERALRKILVTTLALLITLSGVFGMVPQIGTEGSVYAAGTEEAVETENFGTTDADPVD
ncbi:MAG: hypothetical protein IIY82_00485, partial [Firmicutes bacterium]|nr:hypothetical protein [Bacillota bacterium]